MGFRYRSQNKRGFGEYQDGFQICPYQLNRDHWTEGFIID